MKQNLTQNNSIDENLFKSVVGRFPTGVTVITTTDLETKTPIGLTISSFHSLSLNPTLILWTLTKKASTLQHFLKTPSYVVHILSSSQENLAKQFATGPQTERFTDTKTTTAPNGSLMLDNNDCSAWLECKNIAQYEAGDHYIFVGEVLHCDYQEAAPLIYHAGVFNLTPPDLKKL